MNYDDFIKTTYAVVKSLIAKPDAFVIRGKKIEDKQDRMRVYADVARDGKTVIEITVAVDGGIRVVADETLVQGKTGFIKEFKYFSENNRDRKGQMFAQYGYTESDDFENDYAILIK